METWKKLARNIYTHTRIHINTHSKRASTGWRRREECVRRREQEHECFDLFYIVYIHIFVYMLLLARTGALVIRGIQVYTSIRSNFDSFTSFIPSTHTHTINKICVYEHMYVYKIVCIWAGWWVCVCVCVVLMLLFLLLLYIHFFLASLLFYSIFLFYLYSFTIFISILLLHLYTSIFLSYCL